MCDSQNVIRNLLMGGGSADERHAFVERKLLLDSVEKMNSEALPDLLPLYDDEKIPTNQRNLTDVRTRMGDLLEYELARSINSLLDARGLTDIRMMYVVANKFPDLAIRNLVSGDLGIRIEVKTVEAVAEEKSANFDTLLKDIRKGTDYVVVMVWEWTPIAGEKKRIPRVYQVHVFDAYELANLRDTHWLSNPPSDPGEGRQGYDLCYGVNCKHGGYNKEEGNYGKLMRIFRKSDEKWLPDDIKSCATLGKYYSFRQEVIRLGLLQVQSMLASSAGYTALPVNSIPFSVASVLSRGNERILLLGDERMPTKRDTLLCLEESKCHVAILLNEKFDWRVKDWKWEELAQGRKPAEAAAWLKAWKQVN